MAFFSWIKIPLFHGSILSLFFFASCSAPPGEPGEREKTPVIVGKISKVFPQHGFVLIRHDRHIAIPEQNTVLLSQNSTGERLGNLVVTGERLPGGRDFPADIKSGSPAVNDLVFLYESLVDGTKGVRVVQPGEDITPHSSGSSENGGAGASTQPLDGEYKPIPSTDDLKNVFPKDTDELPKW